MGSYKKIELGVLKNLDEITIDDMKKNPIWVADLSGENKKNYDESSQRPILNTVNLTNKLHKDFVTISILIEVEGKNIFGSSDFEEDCSLSTVVLWKNDNWIDANKILNKEDEIILVTPVQINGKKNVKFRYNIENDTAEQIKD